MPPSSYPWLQIGREISEILSGIDASSFELLVRALEPADRRWFFTGQGRSGLSARMAAMRFMHIGRSVHFVGEVSAPSIRRDDGLLVVSASGHTPVSLAFARIARDEGAIVAAVTGDIRSPLAQIADVLLPVPAGPTAQFGGSLFEQCSLILLDSLILQLTDGTPGAHDAMRYRHTNLQ